MLLGLWSSSLFFIKKSEYSTVLLISWWVNHPYTFHANFEVSMEPSFSADKYRIVKVLAVPLKGENEAFHLLSILNTAACGSILLLTYFRFPISKSLNMTAFMESTTGFHSYLYVVLSCGLQVTYTNCSVRAFRLYIKKLYTTFPNLNVPPWRTLWLILSYLVKYFWTFFMYFLHAHKCMHTLNFFLCSCKICIKIKESWIRSTYMCLTFSSSRRFQNKYINKYYLFYIHNILHVWYMAIIVQIYILKYLYVLKTDDLFVCF